METVFNKYKNKLVVHPKYQGYVCGYTDAHIILAVETKSDNFFRKLQNPIIMEEYKDLIAEKRVKVIVIPDICSIEFGRGVGYDIIEHIPPTEVAEISATKIREKLGL